MDLSRYVDDIRRQLAVLAEAGDDETRRVADRLYSPLEPAVRLALQDVLAVAAEEITTELAPGSVELRLRGREPQFVVTLPPTEPGPSSAPTATDEGERGALARINLRLPDHLKERVERAAAAEGLSVNAWLVRAVAAQVDRSAPAAHDPAPHHGRQRYTGWAR